MWQQEPTGNLSKRGGVDVSGQRKWTLALGLQSVRQQFVMDRQEVESDLAGWDGLRQNQRDLVLCDSANRLACVARPELRLFDGVALNCRATENANVDLGFPGYDSHFEYPRNFSTFSVGKHLRLFRLLTTYECRPS